MQTLTLHGKPVAYREWGKGSRVLVLLHGWPADSSHYAELGPQLANAGYRVIVPDFPGFGETPPPEQAWSVSNYRDWLRDFVDALNLNEFVLFGHSFGGRVAIKYAISYPQGLKLLILCAAAGIKTNPRTPKRRILKFLASMGNIVFKLPGLSRFAHQARGLLYKLAGSRDYLRAKGTMKPTIVNVLEEDLSPYLTQIRIKSLLLWGSEDKATPLSHGKRMDEDIAKSELIVFEGAPHNLPKQRPRDVTKAMDNFIKREYDSAIV